MKSVVLIFGLLFSVTCLAGDIGVYELRHPTDKTSLICHGEDPSRLMCQKKMPTIYCNAAIEGLVVCHKYRWPEQEDIDKALSSPKEHSGIS